VRGESSVPRSKQALSMVTPSLLQRTIRESAAAAAIDYCKPLR
jgi:hypothetical protein